MKTVIIVSKCLRVTKFASHVGLYEFHFKGVYLGEKLKKVILKGSFEFEIVKNEEYLVFLQAHSLENGSLFGQVIKVKPIKDCWDRS